MGSFLDLEPEVERYAQAYASGALCSHDRCMVRNETEATRGRYIDTDGNEVWVDVEPRLPDGHPGSVEVTRLALTRYLVRRRG